MESKKVKVGELTVGASCQAQEYTGKLAAWGVCVCMRTCVAHTYARTGLCVCVCVRALFCMYVYRLQVHALRWCFCNYRRQRKSGIFVRIV